MSRKELRPVVSLGMFDLCKGITMLLVVLGHTLDYMVNPLSETNHWIQLFTYYYTAVGNIFLFGFFITSGSGFRKTSFRNCLKQIKRMFLVPYLYTGIIATLLFTFVNFLINAVGSRTVLAPAKNALLSGLHYAVGFALGQYPATTYFGWSVFSCGPMWFVVAICGAWMLLNGILHIRQKWLEIAMVVLCVLFGCGLGTLLYVNDKAVPYCLCHILIDVPGLYIGYLARKHHWYEIKIKLWHLAVLVACIILVFLKSNNGIVYFSYSSLSFPFGVLSYLAGAVTAFFLIYLLVHINRRPCFVTNLFEKIGFYSLYVLCVHTVENFGMHWHIIGEKYPDHPFAVTLVIFILRSLFIVLGVSIVLKFKKAGGWKGIKNNLSSAKKVKEGDSHP